MYKYNAKKKMAEEEELVDYEEEEEQAPADQTNGKVRARVAVAEEESIQTSLGLSR